MSRRVPRLALLVLGALGAMLLLSACTYIKPGSLVVTQPAGIGPVHVHAVVCTSGEELPESEGEAEAPASVRVCGPAEGTAVAQLMLGLMVPTGTTGPETIALTPAAGTPPLTLHTNPGVGPALAANSLLESAEAPPIPPSGVEIVGYMSDPFTETEGTKLEWALDADLVLPASADGGSYGGPYKLTALSGWREVTAELPASRPASCNEGGSFCEIPEPGNEAAVGASELKIAPPKTVSAVPGATARLPFSLDLASGAAPPPAFKLSVASNLSGAKNSVSNDKFNRFPSSTPPYRAPLTTRKAVIGVPKTALPGLYEVTMTATTPQGGSVSSVAELRIKPKGSLTVKVPKKVTVRLASRRGIPVKVNARTAKTKVVARLFGPKPNGKGKRLLATRRSRSKEPGKLILRLKLGKARAAALAGEGAKLRAEVKVFEPKKKGRNFVRVVRLK